MNCSPTNAILTARGATHSEEPFLSKGSTACGLPHRLIATHVLAAILIVACSSGTSVARGGPTMQCASGQIDAVSQPEHTSTVITAKCVTGTQQVLTIEDLGIAGYQGVGSFRAAVLSPNRTRAAFVVHGSSRDILGLWVPATGNITKLMEPVGAGVHGPIWSPDGVYLAITLTLASGLREIDVLDVGTGARPLLAVILEHFHSQHLETFNPVWSPDSKELYFTSKPIEGSLESNWIIGVYGTGLVKLPSSPLPAIPRR